MMEEPAYFKEFSKVINMNSDKQTTWSGKRGELTRKFGWTIPDKNLIKFLVEESKKERIFEIGAGNGYLSYELQKQSGNIIPLDIEPPENLWVPVQKKCYTELNKEKVNSILLPWPPANSHMGTGCINFINPEVVYFIGKENSSITGTESFHMLLDKKYKTEEKMNLPSWTSNSTVFKKCVRI